jgi:hypothetical protein
MSSTAAEELDNSSMEAFINKFRDLSARFTPGENNGFSIDGYLLSAAEFYLM